MKSKHGGFTLIELIVVIVILGILAATALPKFADLSADARRAVLNGALGTIRSAVTIAHASALASGDDCTQNPSTSVMMEGATVTMDFCYPDFAGIEQAVTLDGISGDGAGTFSVDSATATCTLTYTEATSGAPATASLTLTTCT